MQIALPGAGTLRRLLDSDDLCFGGTGARDDKPIVSAAEMFLGRSHSAMLPLAPLSCAYYEFIPDERGLDT